MTALRFPFLLERPEDRNIHGRWHVPDSGARGTVLFLHGFKGYMDWGAWGLVGDHIAAEGWRFLRINFTHNGTTPALPSRFTDLDAFAANTYSRECDEAVAVLRALRTPGRTKESQRTSGLPLSMIGHSRGGGVACLAASEADRQLRREGKNGIDNLVTWAAVADFGSRFPSGTELEDWRASGRREVINHRTRQRLHHDWSFHEDFTAHRERLHIESAIRSFGGRMLIAHGSDDGAVSVDHAHNLASWAHDPELFLMDEAGHTFGSSEPWTVPVLPEPLKILTQTTLRFLAEGRAVGH